MRDCLVLGSGRSGTSMVSGALAGAGAFMGAGLHAPRAANPKGFFEAPEINGINEALLAPMLPTDTDLGEGQRWLGVPCPGAQPTPDAELATRIDAALAHTPYCYKDPRFSFTLPAWRAAATRAGRPDPALVCVFRHPASTATSMVEEVASAVYLANVEFDLARAFELWIATYRAILERARADRGRDWLFLHYDQVLAGDGLERLAAHTGAQLDTSFPDAGMRRDVPDVDVPAEAIEIYEELCRLAEHASDAAAQERGPRPEIGVIVLVEKDEADGARAAVESARNQRGVRVEVVVLDRSGDLAGRDDVAGATVLPSASLSLGADLVRAAELLTAPIVALERPLRPSLPARLVRAAERIANGAQVVTCDQMLTDRFGQFVRRVSAAAMGDAPGPSFEAGLVATRSWFASLPTVAFAPVLLMHWRTSVHAGRGGHVTEPGGTVDAEAYARGWERSRTDARLATQFARERTADGPKLTVSICSYQRRDVLAECLESFCRQEVPVGTFEIVLVDDGSTDGSDAMLADLELPVPATVLRRENGGLSAARNTGLELARGALVLFVNDDTIASSDLVAEHLAAHRAARLAGHGDVAVLGTFEQPQSQFPSVLAQALARTHVVFVYDALEDGRFYDATKFWTCNVSVATDLVRRAGGFDPSFRQYGCEDTDLAARLEDLGLETLFHERARAVHRHEMDMDYLAQRCEAVARAYVRLYRKHPRLLRQWGNPALDVATCRAQLARNDALAAEIEAKLRPIAELSVTDLESLDGGEVLARDGIELVARLLPQINQIWWTRGFLAGFDEHGIDGFAELLADGEEPLPLATASERRLLAWPRWNDPASLDLLMERVRPAVLDGFASLVLRLDPVVDPMQPEAIAALQAAFARHFDDDVDLDVVLDDTLHDAASLLRLGRSVDAFLPLGGEDAFFTERIGAERLADTGAVAAWRRRFEGSADVAGRAPVASSSSVQGVPTPDVSVVVPTRDRAVALGRLIAKLANQTLDPLRYEVLVVDDGSNEPVAAGLAARFAHLQCRVLRQEPSGPCAARNRGIEAARGDVIVFLNDDAVPGDDLLERHLAAQRESDLPRAVVGRFGLLESHRTDSLAEYLERTTSLFAQPLMQAGVHYHGLSLCTGNVSLPKQALVRAGGFDVGFPHAGGEDSEAGLRLEARTGLRVVYDPTIVCGHDHAFDVRALTERKRAVGWSVHRIQSLHGDRGLATGLPWPLAPGQWDELETALAARAARIEALVREVEAFCAAERARGSLDPDGVETLARHLPEIERHHLFLGLVDGARGRRPGAAAPAARFAAAA